MADHEMNNAVELEFPTETDPSKLPTSLKLPEGDMVVEITGFEVGETGDANLESAAKGNPGHKKMVTINVKVVEPSDMAGLPGRKAVYIGSNEDPKAAKPGTWLRNSAPLMQAIDAAGVKLAKGSKLIEAFGAATGQKVGITVKTKPSGDARYEDKNEITAFYAPGKKPVHVIMPGDDVTRAFGPKESAGAKPATVKEFATE